MSQKLVIANWKMKLSPAKQLKLAKDLRSLVKGNLGKGTIAVCPDFLALAKVAKMIKGSRIILGAQDVFGQEVGAYTGEISASELKSLGVKYVIIGHSERRQFSGETDKMVNAKIILARKHKLIPILCIGEKKPGKGREKILFNQLKKDLVRIKLKGAEQIIVAYEPIWAIGTGKVAKPSDAQKAHQYIRTVLLKLYGKNIGNKNFKIIYGGSVSSQNVKDFKGIKEVQGFLVGGASLRPSEFYHLAKNVLE